MKNLQCMEPGCREDLLQRMVTKKMAWLFIMLLAPITFTSLGIAMRVWGQSEFYLVDTAKKNTAYIQDINVKVSKIETQLGFINDRMEKQLQRIMVLERENTEDRNEILNILKGLQNDLRKRS